MKWPKWSEQVFNLWKCINVFFFVVSFIEFGIITFKWNFMRFQFYDLLFFSISSWKLHIYWNVRSPPLFFSLISLFWKKNIVVVDAAVWYFVLNGFYIAGVTPAERLLEMYHGKWGQNVDPVFEELLY